MPQAVSILFGAGFTVVVCAALGSLVLRALSLRFYRSEEVLFSLVAGAPCLSLLVFLLAASGLARWEVFLTAGLLAIALAVWREAFRFSKNALPPLPRFWRLLFGAVFAVFTVLYFFNAMSPEMSPDGSAYHLGLVMHYLRAHGFYRITTNMYANLSQGIEMLFLFAFAFGRHSAAALVHFAFLAALPLAMLCYGRRFGFPGTGAAAALLVYATPVVGIDGVSAYIDVALACVLFVLFYLLQIWDEERHPALPAVAGALAGFGYAIKYTAVIAVLYTLGFVCWKLARAHKPLLRPALGIVLCAAASIAPWMAKNAVFLDNPVSPFFNSVFPNPYVSVGFERQYAAQMRNYQGLRSRREIPLELTIRGDVLGGLLGPLYLLSPLALLALRRRAGRQLLLAAGFFGLAWFVNIGTRFLIPALPFLSLAMMLAFREWKYALAAVALAHAALSWPNVLKLYCARNAWRLDKVPVRQALRLEPEESWLARRMPRYPVARLIEEKVPPGGVVLAFTPLAESYTTREVRIVYQSASNSNLGDILHMPLIPEYPATWRLRFRFPAQPLSKIRVVQTAAGGPDQWSITELRVYNEGKEVPRAAYWRLRASPNPWDIQMAFDNSPVTRWRSGQTLCPGMFVQVDFGRLTRLESVLLESSRDQYKVRVRLEGQDPDGHWKPLAAAPEENESAPPLGLRRMAVEELRAQRVGYLVMYDSDFGAGDLQEKSAVWGIRLLGKRSGAKLYELGPR